jgi:hypothetical protein
MIPGPACVWRNKHQLWLKSTVLLYLLILTPNVEAWNRKLVAVRVGYIPED